MTDSNGGGSASTSRTFTVAAGNTGTLNIQVNVDTNLVDLNGQYFNNNGNGSNDDIFAWQLTNLADNSVVRSAQLNQDGVINVSGLAA